MFPEIIGTPFANKNTKLFLAGKVVKRLITEGQEAFPLEYSALLVGYDATVTDYIPAGRNQQVKHAFHWNGEMLLSSLRSIQHANLQWLGVLHTHPHTPAIPSHADINGWHYPSLCYWILSLAGKEPDLRLYQFVDGCFTERLYMLTDSSSIQM